MVRAASRLANMRAYSQVRHDLSPDRQPPGGAVAPLGHTKIESTVRYLGIEVDDALVIAEQVDV
jgi:hypothetical protein